MHCAALARTQPESPNIQRIFPGTLCLLVGGFKVLSLYGAPNVFFACSPQFLRDRKHTCSPFNCRSYQVLRGFAPSQQHQVPRISAGCALQLFSTGPDVLSFLPTEITHRLCLFPSRSHWHNRQTQPFPAIVQIVPSSPGFLLQSITLLVATPPDIGEWGDGGETFVFFGARWWGQASLLLTIIWL